jgi:predicted RND superfamily exporter protein
LANRSIYSRFGTWVLLLAVLAMPVLIYGAKSAIENNRNDLLDWMPKSFGETARLFWFVERFGSDEIMVISWPGCSLDDARLEQLSQQLTQPVQIPGRTQPAPLFRLVFTGPQTLDELTSKPLSLPRSLAIERMQGWLIGADQHTTCAVALVSKVGELDRRAALNLVYQVADQCGVARADLRVGGGTADGVAIEDAATKWLTALGWSAVFLALLVASVCLREFRLVTLLYAAAMFAWATSLSVVHYSGHHLDSVLMLMPALVFVLSISGGIHLTNYYADAIADRAPEPPLEAIRRGWLPCTLAAVTTSIGIGSLAISKVPPVRNFGIFAATGVLLSLLALLVIWPSLATRWKPNERTLQRLGERKRTRLSENWWRPVFAISYRFWVPVLLLAVVLLPIFGFGLTKLRTSTQLKDLLRSHSEPLRNYQWLEQNLGPLIPVEVVLGFPRDEQADSRVMLDRAQLVDALRQKLSSLPDVGGTMAATTFAPELPSGTGARSVMQRRVLSRRLQRHRDDFEELRFLKEDDQEELWRISVRIPSIQSDYGPFLEQLDDEVQRRVRQFESESGQDVSVRICGGVPLIYMAQHRLLVDLIESFLLAFALVGVTMIVLIRDVVAGALSMIPNVFPALVAFGTMGLLGTAVDIGTMMTASAAMGIAVDDTLHFLVWFRRGVSRGKSRREAVYFAFKNCATALLQTSVICSIGLVVFVLSPFEPVSKFARVMATLLFLALVGDLILLPAMLISPLGQWFMPRASRARQAATYPGIQTESATTSMAGGLSKARERSR